MAELRQLGGAVGRPAPGGGALSHFDGAFIAFALGSAFDEEDRDRSQIHADRLVDALAPWAGGRLYLNFVEEEIETAVAYEAGVFERLQAIRAQVDPTGLFRANHVI